MVLKEYSNIQHRRHRSMVLKDEVKVSISLPNNEDDDEEQIFRSQGWLRGKVILVVRKKEEEKKKDAENRLNGSSGGGGNSSSSSSSSSFTLRDLKVNLVGRESAYSPRLSFMGTSMNERTVFEDQRILHEYDKSSSNKNNSNSNSNSNSNNNNNALLKSDRTYTYPFSIYLPGSIPPSMEYEGESCACGVQYALSAQLTANEDNNSSNNNNRNNDNISKDCIVEDHISITIAGATVQKTCSARPRTLKPAPFPIQASSRKLLNRMVAASKGIVRKGSCVIFGAKLENTQVSKGQNVTVSLACRNRSRVEIDWVDVKVVEEIKWKPDSLGKDSKIAIILAQALQVVLPGLQTHVVDGGGEGGTPSSSKNVDALTQQEMHSELQSKSNQLVLPIPTTTRSSYVGKLVKVLHFVEVTMHKRQLPTSLSKLNLMMLTSADDGGGGGGDRGTSPNGTGDNKKHNSTVVVTVRIPIKVLDPSLEELQQEPSRDNDAAVTGSASNTVTPITTTTAAAPTTAMAVETDLFAPSRRRGSLNRGGQFSHSSMKMTKRHSMSARNVMMGTQEE